MCTTGINCQDLGSCGTAIFILIVIFEFLLSIFGKKLIESAFDRKKETQMVCVIRLRTILRRAKV